MNKRVLLVVAFGALFLAVLSLQSTSSDAAAPSACSPADGIPGKRSLWIAQAGGPPGYTFCAHEGQRCAFTGTADVAYGAQGRFNYKQGISGGIDCNNAAFGDPNPGVLKACWIKAVGGNCPSITDWKGEYWNNATLSGSPVLCRNDIRVSFNWGTGSPAGVLPNNRFSARWTRNVDLAAGRYRFHLAGDDGIRLWVDGILIIDQWHDQGRTEYTADRQLTAGTHSLRVEYYENSGEASVALWREKIGMGCTPNSEQVALFVDANYQGQCTVRGVGGYPSAATFGLPNDAVSSIKVGANVKATLCRDNNYGGLCQTFTADDARLSDNPIGNDQVSSVKVEPRSDGGPAGYTFCARENQRCSFSGTKDVAYGANGRFNFRNAVTGGVDCNNAIFGDPIPGVVKACYTKDIGAVCPTITDWKGEYWNNPTLTSSPVLCRNDARVDFNWGTGGPGGGVPNNRFSARWTRSLDFAGGRYRFHLAGDDGIRFWLDGTLIIDQWRDQSRTEYTADRDLTAGSHSLKVEYYEKNVEASVALWWEPLGGGGGGCPPITDWKGQYWNNKTLSGNPVLCRNDVRVDFNWGTGGPGSGVPNDLFSARWTRSLNFAAGRYRFHLAGDDGIRLWVDGTLIIDQWRDQSRTEYTADRELTAGSHNLKVEYYERTVEASVTLWWELAGGGCTPNANQIALFVHADYAGQCVLKSVGGYPSASAIGLTNDAISSIKVGANVRAILCRDNNYSGICETFTANDNNLTNNSVGNDQVSSAKVEPRAGATSTGHASARRWWH